MCAFRRIVNTDWPFTINGMLEGSTRSRDTDGADSAMRDVVEASVERSRDMPGGLWALDSGKGFAMRACNRRAAAAERQEGAWEFG